ncbi:serine/threonine protein kinase [Myxococcota bacterium]|nr:serine/threonine protein kinase [Myxococcota bacterium]
MAEPITPGMIAGVDPTTLVLGGQLGQGALASVWSVHAPDGRSFAGKILHRSAAADPQAVERFAREAELLRGVHHEHLVEVHGLATIEGQHVLLMELVVGPTLAELAANEGPLPEARILRLARGIAAGLAAAHAAGLTHRDLKPANILVAKGDVAKITDFGLARATSLARAADASTTFVGTPDYMAPECLDPIAIDARTDLYALGCILFELAIGYPPYGGATPFAVLDRHRRAPIPELPAGAALSLPFTELVRALLAKAPGDRPQSATAVVEVIDGLLGARDRALTLRAVALDEVSCARCGAPVIRELGSCARCALPMVRLERGRHAVLVVGPGAIGDKLDVHLRERLLAWVTEGRALGLDPARLARDIPRLPFVAIAGVSAGTAESFARSLSALGLDAKVVQGSSLGAPEMRRKVWELSKRALIAMAGALYLMVHLPRFSPAMTFVALALAVLGPAAALAFAARLSLTHVIPTTPAKSGLPRTIADALDRIAKRFALVREPRHRAELEAIVRRVLGILRTGARDVVLVEGLSESLRVAETAVLRLAVLDGELASRDLRQPDAETRKRLHERDLWSGRLLELSSSLESMHARLAAADARGRAAEIEAPLRAIEAQIEALEEVDRR